MENFFTNILNTSLFSSLILINIILCFSFGNYILKVILPSEYNFKNSNNKNVYIVIIIGFIVICSLLSFINLFIKINYLIFIILVSISIFTLEYKANFLFIKKYKTYLLYLIIILFLSKISMISYFTSDTGYYHVPVIKIYNDYNTIFGLANIFPQYGFNNLNFYFSSMLTANPLFLRFFSVPTVVFFFITSLYIFNCRKEYKNKFTFLILLGGFFYINVKYLSSISPDFYVNCICIIIFSEIYIKSIYKKNISDQSLLQIMFLSIMIITIKLSSIFFSLLIISFLFIFYNKHFLKAKFIRLFVMIFILLTIFFIKNILYSGSLFFPSGLGTFNFLWSVPGELSDNLLSWVKSFARNPYSIPEEVLINYEWIYEWLQRTDKLFLISIFISILIYIFNIYANPKKIFLKNTKLNYLIFVYSFSIIFWFLNAPDIRFSLMLNLFLFLLVIDMNTIYKKKLNDLILKLSLPGLSIIIIYTFIYLNFINIFQNHQKLEFKNGWRSIDNHEFKLKDYEFKNGLNFYFIEGYCWFTKTLCTTEGRYFDYETKVRKLNNNYVIYLKK